MQYPNGHETPRVSGSRRLAVIKQSAVILNGGPQGFQNLPFVSSCRRRFSAHLPRHAKQFLNVW